MSRQTIAVSSVNIQIPEGVNFAIEEKDTTAEIQSVCWFFSSVVNSYESR